MARIDTIRNLLEQDPANSRIRFMLCMEYVSAGEWAQARNEFEELLRLDGNYVPGYYHAGRAYEALGDVEAARNVYRQGIETAGRNNDAHARSELQAALDLLG